MRFPPLPDEAASERARGQARREARAQQERAISRRRAPRDAAGRARDRLYNAIAALFALATVIVLAVVVFLWSNYNSPLNPLAPPTPLAIVVTATYTPTFTLTPSITLTPSATYTPTPAPTLTPSLTFTPVLLDGFTTPDGTAPGTAPVAGTPGAVPDTFAFALQRGIVYITNPDGRGGCRWASIAGSVMNYEGGAVNGYQMRIVGEGVDETVTTGSAPGNGPGGFEVVIGDSARDGVYVAELRDPSGTPVSTAITVTTRADCAQNIAALRLVAVAPSN